MAIRKLKGYIMFKTFIPAVLIMFVTSMAADNAYVGTKKCGMCHKGEKGAMVLEKWQEAKHSDAYNVLATDKAKEVAKEMGVAGNLQEAAECLECHTTAYGADPKLTMKLKVEDGVSCEACHGAGAAYAKKPIMKVHKKAVMKGMVDSPKDICVNCHKEELKHVKKFVYEERWNEIKHSRPVAKK
jgi:hypothetical protein